MTVDRRCCHYSSGSSSGHWGLAAVSIVAAMFNHPAGQGFVLAQNSLSNMFDSAPSTIPGALLATRPTTSSVLIVPAQGQSQSQLQSLQPAPQPHRLRTTHKDMVHDSPAASVAPRPSPIALTLIGVESVLSTPTVVGPTGQPQSRSRTASPFINGSPFEAGQRSQRPAAPALSTLQLPIQSTASSVLVVPPRQAANDTKSNTATSNGVESDSRWNVSALNILLSTPDEETDASDSLIPGRGERKGGKGRFRGMGSHNKSGNGQGRRKGKGGKGGGGNNRAKGRGKGGNGEKHGKGGGMGRGKGGGGKGHGGKGGHGKGSGNGGKGGHGGHGMMLGSMNMGMMGGGGSGYMMGKGKGGMGGMRMMGKMMKPRTHPPTPSPSPSPSSASPSPFFFETLLPTTYSSTLFPTSFTTELPTTAIITNEPTESFETVVPTPATTVAPTNEQQETIPPTPSAAPITTDAPSAVVVSPTATTVPPSLVSNPVTSPTVVTLPPDIQSIVPTIIPSNSFSSSGPSATIGPSLRPSIIPSNSFSSSGPVATTPPATTFTSAPITRSPITPTPFASITAAPTGIVTIPTVTTPPTAAPILSTTAAPVLGPTTAVPATPFSLTFDGASSDATPQDYETVIQPIVLNYLSDFLAENFALSLEFQYAALNATLLSSTPGGDNTWLTNYDLDGLFTSTSLPSTPELDVLLTVAFALPFVADLVALIQAAAPAGPFSTTTAVTYSATPNTL